MDGGEGDGMRPYLQGIAAVVMFVLSLIADGAMEAWGDWVFTLVYTVALLICAIFIFRGGPPSPPAKRNRPRSRYLRERHDQPTRG